uniref:Uncharacterized protein n=1 Tax=Hyaloperonospora arabidopsidis (strain Emoy2) TaxID=559515 RepID=M4BW95_HYAAE
MHAPLVLSVPLGRLGARLESAIGFRQQWGTCASCRLIREALLSTSKVTSGSDHILLERTHDQH